MLDSHLWIEDGLYLFWYENLIYLLHTRNLEIVRILHRISLPFVQIPDMFSYPWQHTSTWTGICFVISLLCVLFNLHVNINLIQINKCKYNMAIYRSAMWQFLKRLFREDDLKCDTLYHFSLEFYV